MNRNTLYQALDQCAGQEVGSPDLWPAIRERLPARSSRSKVRLPTGRLGWIAAVMGVLLIISTVAYATAPLLTGVYTIVPHWEGVAGRSYPLSLSQTADGCTVTIEQAYADAERIVLGGTVAGPEGMSLGITKSRLTDAEGTELPWIEGAGHVEVNGEAAWVLSFDPSVLGELPSELRLRLSLYVSGIVIGEAAPPIALPAEAGEDSVAVELSPLETTLYGPFTFEFTVPVTR